MALYISCGHQYQGKLGNVNRSQTIETISLFLFVYLIYHIVVSTREALLLDPATYMISNQESFVPKELINTHQVLE